MQARARTVADEMHADEVGAPPWRQLAAVVQSGCSFHQSRDATGPPGTPNSGDTSWDRASECGWLRLRGVGLLGWRDWTAAASDPRDTGGHGEGSYGALSSREPGPGPLISSLGPPRDLDVLPERIAADGLTDGLTEEQMSRR